MNREIKFRAWDKRNKCWSIEPLYIDEEGRLYEIYERSFAFENYMHKEYVSEEHDVCWYTGLKDKNGVEIYEGDIVKGHYWYNQNKSRIVGTVSYVGAAFQVIGVKKYQGWLCELHSAFEVIGNIYEHPNLLKDGESA